MSSTPSLKQAENFITMREGFDHESSDPYKEIKEKSGALSADCESSSIVGKLLAKRAIKKGIKQVIFDRGGNLYHGRVKALAEAAREAGLNF